MTGEFDAHERRMWAGVAEAYARSFAGLCAGAVPALLDAAEVGPGLTVLDVGTGPGTVAAAAGERGALVTAVDAAPEMLELAAARAPKAEVRLAVLPELPFADASFDAVVANFVVNHVEDPVAALAELRRVTRPGGRIAATIWSSASNGAMELFNRALDAANVERPVFPAVPVDFDRSPDGFAGLLARAGWSGAVGRELSWTHRAHPEDWWAGPAGGVANIGLVVAAQTAGAAAVIKQHYDRLAAEQLADDGRLAVPATAVLALARAGL